VSWCFAFKISYYFVSFYLLFVLSRNREIEILLKNTDREKDREGERLREREREREGGRERANFAIYVRPIKI
jgi:hypothetical protein